MALFNKMRNLFSKTLHHQRVSTRSYSALDFFFKFSMQAFLSLMCNGQMNMIFDHIWCASSDVAKFVNKLNQYVMPLYREINDILTTAAVIAASFVLSHRLNNVMILSQKNMLGSTVVWSIVVFHFSCFCK